MSKNNFQPQGGFILEILRKSLTDLTQDQFCVLCGISRTTYQSWIRKGTGVPPLNPEQLIGVCKVCRITPMELLEKMGLDTSEVSKIQNESSISEAIA